jgi:SAM-dependent methyltransferase
MPSTRVNYDRLAPTYHQRYAHNPLSGVAEALRSLLQEVGAQRALEVGCGTGRWLRELGTRVPHVHGVDLSHGMLRQGASPSVACAHACHLPFPETTFDLVFCVNALHHFDKPGDFIAHAQRLLRPGGVLAIVGMDPHTRRDRWYLYDYFDETLGLDLRRFPSSGTLLDWMAAAGFVRIAWRVVERIVQQQVGRAVMSDHFLQKDSTSQLALLSDAAYSAGLRRMQAALARAEACGETLTFTTDLSLMLVTGWA